MIRIAVEADVPAILEIYAPYVRNTTCSFEYDAPTQEAFLTRFRRITARCPWLVWEEDGVILGYTYGSIPFERAAYAWSGEVSIYVAPEAKGRGIGRKLYAALEAVMQYQGYRVLYSVVTSENTASVAFHEKVGYRFLAEMPACGLKFGRWLGITWLEKRLNSVELPMNPPIAWKEIMENDGKRTDILAILSLS